MDDTPMSISAIDTSEIELRPLVERCVAGCQHAMAELVARFQGRIFGLCFRMLGSREDAEEVAQETFLRVLKNLSRWDPAREFEPWIMTIAGNRCRSALAVRKTKPRAESLTIDIPNESGERAAKDLSEELNQALARLRVEYREAFVLFHEQQRSYEEISDILSVPLGTVKTWVHRARRELIESLREREALTK